MWEIARIEWQTEWHLLPDTNESLSLENNPALAMRLAPIVETSGEAIGCPCSLAVPPPHAVVGAIASFSAVSPSGDGVLPGGSSLRR